jgi:hypothetical protein
VKTVKIIRDFYIGDAGGEGSNFVSGNIMNVTDEIAETLIQNGAAIIHNTD